MALVELVVCGLLRQWQKQDPLKQTEMREMFFTRVIMRIITASNENLHNFKTLLCMIFNVLFWPEVFLKPGLVVSSANDQPSRLYTKIQM